MLGKETNSAERAVSLWVHPGTQFKPIGVKSGATIILAAHRISKIVKGLSVLHRALQALYTCVYREMGNVSEVSQVGKE